MRASDFFMYLFITIRLRGTEWIETRDNAHHRSFSRVAEDMKNLGKADDMPVFIPSFISEQYAELNMGILELVLRSVCSIQMPYAEAVHLNISLERSERILSRLSAEKRKLFERWAKIFLEPVDRTEIV